MPRALLLAPGAGSGNALEGNCMKPTRGEGMSRTLTVRLAAAVVVAAALAGCAAPRPAVPMKTLYNEAQHDPWRVDGKNTVTGQAFMRQVGGGTVSCAGTTAAIFPDTAFFREMADILGRGGKPDVSAQARPSRDRSTIRNAVCDAQGNFAIEQVPAGRWLLISDVRWSAGRSPQGGMLMRPIEVKDGAANRFLLTDADLYRAN